MGISIVREVLCLAILYPRAVPVNWGIAASGKLIYSEIFACSELILEF